MSPAAMRTEGQHIQHAQWIQEEMPVRLAHRHGLEEVMVFRRTDLGVLNQSGVYAIAKE